MSTHVTRDWRELLDVALFEPNRARLRRCIEHAKHAIGNRLDALIPDIRINDQGENGRIVAERIALNDALTTLAELHKLVFARKPRAGTGREHGRGAGQAAPE